MCECVMYVFDVCVCVLMCVCVCVCGFKCVCELFTASGKNYCHQASSGYVCMYVCVRNKVIICAYNSRITTISIAYACRATHERAV